MKNLQITGFLAILIIGFLLMSGCTKSNTNIQLNQTEITQIKTILSHQIDLCKKMDDNIITRGKYLVINTFDEPDRAIDFNKEAEITRFLAQHGDTRPSSFNESFTVFLIINTWKNQGKTYLVNNRSESPISVYTQSSEICVFYWPERKIIGHKIVTDDIPSTLGYTGGDSQTIVNDGAISLWIESLKRQS